MWDKIKALFKRVWDSTVTSGTVLWSRIQYPLAAAWLALSQTDLSPFFSNPKFFAAWMVINAFVTENVRRHQAEYTEDGKMR